MSLVSLLATTTLITLATSTPMILAGASGAAGGVAGNSQRARIPVDRDHYLLIMLLNRRDFGLKTKPSTDTGDTRDTNGFDSGGTGAGLTRDKRIGSLSIVNSVDVMRQRILLELARRKAMENQRQISENRRILDSVGKRSYSQPGLEGFAYRDHRISRKKRLQLGTEDGPGEERLERLLLMQ